MQPDPSNSGSPEQVNNSPSRSFFHQAAKFSFWAPIAAIGIGLATATMRDADKSVAIAIGLINVILILAGLILSVVALLGMRKVGRQGVLGYGLAGLILNSLFVSSIAVLWFASIDMRQKADARYAEQVAADQEMGRLSLLNFPGWVGMGEWADAQFIVASLHADAPMAQMINGDLQSPVGVVVVSVINESDKELSMELASLRFMEGDQVAVQALGNDEFFPLFGAQAPKARASLADPRSVAAHSTFETFTAIPAQSNLRQAETASLSINGQTLTIEGRFLSVEEKQQTFAAPEPSELQP